MTSSAIRVQEPTDVAEARRVASRVAGGVGFDETDAGRVALVATELASNLLKHADGGELVVRAVDDGAGDRVLVEILSIDRAGGMRDVDACLADGFSTAGSHGIGLGAVRRTSAEFDIFSVQGQGTALVARIVRRGAPARPHAAFRVGAVSVCYPGELECGDAWAVLPTRAGGAAVIVADGLGHGPAAADAARRARQVFLEHHDRGPGAVIERVHEELRSSRGAAVAVTQIEPGAGVRHCGLGNISAAILSDGRAQQLVSLNGTAGHQMHRIREFEYAWSPHALLVAHSDGLHTRWRLDTYRGVEHRDPGLVAAVLYRDARRERDDVTVCAVAEANGAPRFQSDGEPTG